MTLLWANEAARSSARRGKIGVQKFATQCAASKRWLTVEAPMPSKPDPAEMPRLDVFDEEFGQDPATILRAERRGFRGFFLLSLSLLRGVIGRPPLSLCVHQSALPRLRSVARPTSRAQ